MNTNLPARHLPERPDLDQLKRQAKELLAGFAARESNAVAELRQYYPGAPLDTLRRMTRSLCWHAPRGSTVGQNSKRG